MFTSSLRLFLFTLSIFVVSCQLSTSTTSNNNSTIATSDDERKRCKNLYGHRSYFDGDNKPIPALLYTFPGSGVTWTRLLLEFSTGIYTGTVYKKEETSDMMPGKCNDKVLAIKFHTLHYHAENILKKTPERCEKHGFNHIIKSIHLIRNPYDAIWSEYQRSRLTTRDKDIHAKVLGIPRNEFKWNDWINYSKIYATKYREMLRHHYPDMINKLGEKNVFTFRYEDLINTKLQYSLLSQLVTFLNVTIVDADRLKCAFILSESPKAHRKPDPNDMSKQEAYTSDIVCRIWRILEDSIIGMGLNYTVYGGYTCTKPSAAEEVEGE